MTHSAMRRLASLVVLVVAVGWAMWLYALTDVYIAQTASASPSGSSCTNARALSSLTAGDWVADTTIHVCGTVTSPLIAQGSGASSSHPITIQGEVGSVFSAPVWSFSTGAINISGRSFITVRGVTIQNTANSTATGTTATVGILAGSCNGCVITSSTIHNMFIHAQGGAVTTVDQSQLNAIQITGSNWTISNNTIHDCGWCIRVFYANGDSNNTISGNNIFNMDHGVALASVTAGAVYSGLSLFGNHMHDTANWDGPAPYPAGCFAHHDGFHAFGTTLAGQTMTEVYLHDNLFDGNWGHCPTAFVFIEGGTSSNRSNMINFYEFNDVGNVPAGAAENTQGWFAIFMATGKLLFAQNTVTGPSEANNGKGFNIGCTQVSAGDCLKNPTIENNAEQGFGGKVDYNPSGLMTIDFNGYDPFCNLGNCFTWKGLFKSTFTNWKNALVASSVSGADSHGINTTLGLNSNGTITSPASAVVNAGTNLTSLAVSNPNLSGLVTSTTAGGTAVPVARPASGNWTIGAFALGTTIPPNPPTGLAASASGSTVTLTATPSSGIPTPTAYNLYRGTVHGGPYTLIQSGLSSPNTTDTPANGTYFYTETAFVGGQVSSISGNGSTVTVTCVTTCTSFPTGTALTIGGDSNAAFNGTFTSTGQPTSTTFTFASSTVGSGTGGGAWPTSQESAKSNEVTATVPANKTVTLTPSTLTFGSFTVGATSPSQAATLTNTSGAAISVTISSIAASGDFGQTNTCPGTLPSGSNCTINVTFTPTAPGTRNGTLTVTDNATGSPHTVSLTGTGVAQTPIITLAPSSHDFGSQLLSTTSVAFPFTLTNSGTGTATISSITPSGDFAVFSTTCGGALLAGNQCFINVNFTPTVSGGRTGSLSVIDSAAGSPHVATLSGTGITTKCQVTGGVTISGQAIVCGP